MAKKIINNVKLGIFVLGGLLFLILLLYMIGKNRSLFGNTYVLKARFENVQGLVPGNNVRFAGIQAGTVKRIIIIADTLIEVTMIIDSRMKDVIRKNAIVSIGTDGLVGNKVVNIVPSKEHSSLALEDDILPAKKAVNTDEMLQILYNTNNDVAVIANGLKETIQRINGSNVLWTLLNDKSLPLGIRSSVSNIRSASAKTDAMVNDLQMVVTNIKEGKGSVGELLQDTSFAHNLNAAVQKIQSVGDEAMALTTELKQVVAGIQQDINTGKGTVNSLLKDSLLVVKLNTSLDNIQKGTDGFNQNMEALKHNFLFRGYFKKLEKQKKKEQSKSLTQQH
ncbi:MAG TPA: MlaD family protein [Niabella sp.]|nr:MCE family protein [Chitinophagaceae bacterium]HRO86028.1 MlaD family protein [Niabella sp.]HRP31386.1 MlaD family protein [Agriterribacter sp.]